MLLLHMYLIILVDFTGYGSPFGTVGYDFESPHPHPRAFVLLGMHSASELSSWCPFDCLNFSF